MAWMVGCCCRARLSSSPTCVGIRAAAAADISAARRAEDHLFGSRHPGRFGLVVGEPRGGLQRLLICVQDQVPFVVFLAGTRTELNGTATSFSPMPRNPPTPMIMAVTRPSLSIKAWSPILLSD